VKELVHEQSHARLPLGGNVLPDERGPAFRSPAQRGVGHAEHGRTRRFGLLTIGGDGPRCCVSEDHRTAERHAPEAAAFAGAEFIGFREVRLRPALIDLRLCDGRRGKHREGDRQDARHHLRILDWQDARVPQRVPLGPARGFLAVA
jgi:hypothetical protein